MLKLSDLRKTLPFKISQNLSTGTIKDFADFYLKTNNYYILDFDVYLPSIQKNLQRDLCWTLEQKQALILSVFKEIYIPSISAIQFKDNTGQKTLEIIDGKQRLSTMIAFYNNEFPITVDGKDFYYFKTLSDELRSYYQRQYVTVNIAYSYDDYDKISDQSKIDWFEMINFLGTSQDIEHLNNLKK